MRGYTVDVDALNDLQQQMQHFLVRATENLVRVESLIESVSADWDGAAASAYQKRHCAWASALREIHETLADFTAWSHDAEQAYREVMEINLRMAQS